MRRLLAALWDEDVFNVSAQLAFYYFLAVFPLLVFFVALLGYLPIEGASGDMVEAVRKIAPQAVGDTLQRELSRLLSARRGDLLFLGAFGALWSGSSAMASTIKALNRAFDVQEMRPWWKMRLTAALLTIGMAGFALIALLIVMTGPAIGLWLARRVGAGAVFDAAWWWVRWPFALALVVAAVDLVFRFAPNAGLRWVWLSPGSVVATALWVALSLGFRAYLQHFGSFGPTYGALGAVIVVLLWFYLSAVALLAGAVLDSTLDRLAKEGDPAGGRGSGRRN